MCDTYNIGVASAPTTPTAQPWTQGHDWAQSIFSKKLCPTKSLADTPIRADRRRHLRNQWILPKEHAQPPSGSPSGASLIRPTT